MGNPVSLSELFGSAPETGSAVVDGGLRLSGVEVAARSAHLAGGLAARGVGQSDVVAWQLPNIHEAILCYRATWHLGAVAAPLHHRAGEAEVGALLDRLAPSVTLATPDLAAATAPGVVQVRGDGGFEALATTETIPPEPTPVEPTDRAVVLFTSGSSDVPKGVVHTHRSLAGKAATMVEVHGLGPDDVVLMPAPLAHVSGLLNAVLVPGAAAMTTVLMERWDPAAALDLIEAEQVSFMVGPPTFFLDLMEDPGFRPERVASLRVISAGGTGVSPGFVGEAGEALGATVKRSYGSTEAPTVATSYAGDPPERAATTDGRAVGDVELRIVDPATGAQRGAGEAGELWVRGDEVFAGYLDPARTAEVMDDGFFRTGDLATIEDGWLTVVGRLSETIIRGGENVAPAEIEAVLEAHPDVDRAVVVGLADERWGETVAAAVVAESGFDIEACRAWFAEQGVARFKTPERVAELDEVPVLASGKLDRRAVRAILETMLTSR